MHYFYSNTDSIKCWLHVFHFICSGSCFTTPTSTLISSPTATLLFLKLLPYHLFLSDIFSHFKQPFPFWAWHGLVPQKTLPARSRNFLHKSSKSSQVATSSVAPCHLSNTSTAARFRFLFSRRWRTHSGTGARVPSIVTSGSYGLGWIRSPKVFFRLETWKIGNILDSAGRSSLYATFLTR